MRPERKRTTRLQRCASECVVRHEHQRGAAFFVTGKQQFDDLAAGAFVEIAGRLVGDEDRRMRRERARERDALLLAAGQLRRIVIDAVAQADRGELRGGALEGVGRAREFERHRDVLQARSWWG